MVRCADDNGIEALLLYKLAIIRVDNGIWKALLCNGDVFIIDVTDSGDVL